MRASRWIQSMFPARAGPRGEGSPACGLHLRDQGPTNESNKQLLSAWICLGSSKHDAASPRRASHSSNGNNTPLHHNLPPPPSVPPPHPPHGLKFPSHPHPIKGTKVYMHTGNTCIKADKPTYYILTGLRNPESIFTTCSPGSVPTAAAPAV